MNWKRFLGENLYEKLTIFCKDRNMSLASAVRAAIAQYVEM